MHLHEEIFKARVNALICKHAMAELLDMLEELDLLPEGAGSVIIDLAGKRATLELNRERLS